MMRSLTHWRMGGGETMTITQQATILFIALAAPALLALTMIRWVRSSRIQLTRVEKWGGDKAAHVWLVGKDRLEPDESYIRKT